MDLRKMQTILHEARHKIMMKPEFQKIMDKYFLKEETFVRYLDKEFFPELDAYLPDFEYPEEADKIYKKAVEEYKDKFTKEDKGFINKLKSFFADGGREDFAEGTKKYDYSNPLQKNQFIMRSNEEIQAIIDDPKYKNYTRKDFRNEGILTRKETERPDLKFKNFGKKIKVDKRKRADESIKKFIKEAQGSQISMDVNNNFAHFAPKLKAI